MKLNLRTHTFGTEEKKKRQVRSVRVAGMQTKRERKDKEKICFSGR